jgi:hypothetical protein
MATVQRTTPANDERAIPLMVRYGMWSLVPQDEDVLALVRKPRWLRRHALQALAYLAAALVYLAISVATLTSEIALPNAGTIVPDPQWLPYLGLLAAALLLGLALRQGYLIASRPDRYEIDPRSATITARRRGAAQWARPFGAVQSVYVTEQVKRAPSNNRITYGELNLHLGGEDFLRLFDAEIVDDRQPHLDDPQARPATEDIIVPLYSGDANSDLQRAGARVASTIGVPCWYDQRVK